jgi:predicted XRE-type DNA-binding protein
MDDVKRKALEAAGFRVGGAAEFLGLTDEERKLVELRLGIARAIRQRREAAELSQKEAAARIGTTQPRFNKIEAGASDVSLDQMMRGFFALGGRVTIAGEPPRLRSGASKRVTSKERTPRRDRGTA